MTREPFARPGGSLGLKLINEPTITYRGISIENSMCVQHDVSTTCVYNMCVQHVNTPCDTTCMYNMCIQQVCITCMYGICVQHACICNM